MSSSSSDRKSAERPRTRSETPSQVSRKPPSEVGSVRSTSHSSSRMTTRDPGLGIETDGNVAPVVRSSDAGLDRVTWRPIELCTPRYDTSCDRHHQGRKRVSSMPHAPGEAIRPRNERGPRCDTCAAELIRSLLSGRAKQRGECLLAYRAISREVLKIADLRGQHTVNCGECDGKCRTGNSPLRVHLRSSRAAGDKSHRDSGASGVEPDSPLRGSKRTRALRARVNRGMEKPPSRLRDAHNTAP